MFKIGAIILVVLCSNLIDLTTSDSSKFSICERRRPTPTYSIGQLKCPPETVWFGTSILSSTSGDKKYCCGTIENRFCCKKSEFKKELYFKQRSEHNMSISGTLLSIAFFALLICICCRCIGMCFRTKKLNTGLVITSMSGQRASAQTSNLNGQNVHVISQVAPQPPAPQYANPYQQHNYPQNQYPPTSYPGTQYPPNQYPATSFSDFNQPPPAYSTIQNPPIYPPAPVKTETNQTSANDKSGAPAPSAPDF